MRFVFMILLGLWTIPALAVDQHAGDTLYDEGDAAYEAGDYDKAREIMEDLAAQGHAKAMNAIGVYHAKGKAYPVNRILACDWYKKSAKAGYNTAQYNITFCFKDQNSEITDHDNWLYWMETAAKNDYKHAQTVLMKYYIRKNKEKSFYWAKRAAAQGSVAARVTLWQYDQDQGIAPITFSEIACVFIRLDILKHYTDSCDD